MSQALQEFIKDATKAGRSRAEIASVLREAGWADAQITEAFSGYLDRDYPVLVPRPKAHVSPRFTALNLFYFLALGVLIYCATAIFYTFLDYHMLDGTGQRRGLFYASYSSFSDAIRSYLATLLAALPLLWLAARLLKRSYVSTGQQTPMIRLRLIYLFLFLGAFALLCSFAGFIYYFLSGELGLRFIIKVGVLCLLVGGIYSYFRPEIRDHEASA